MHTTRSPPAVPPGISGDPLDLSLAGSQITVSKRPSSASPGKHFSRSVSVSVASYSRGKRNTLSDSSSIKNLRRSNSTTQVNQQDNSSSSEDYLSLIGCSSDGRRKLASLSKASPDRTTWNILDDQPRAATHSSSHSTSSLDSPTSLKKRESSITLAATFTANNRSNKGAVGNSVTTILHNNHPEKPLTPKSSNQRPAFNNLLKATVNDDVSLESSSLTKSQKNFSSGSPTSNSRAPLSPRPSSPIQCRKREVSKEEAERFIQQVNQAAVTIQRWYRCHTKKRLENQEALRDVLTTKRKEWEARTEAEYHLELQQKKDEDRRRAREEKARLARLAAIQELQKKRAQRAAQVEPAGCAEKQTQKAAAARRKPTKSSVSTETPPPTSNNRPLLPPYLKAKNTDSHINTLIDFGELSFRAVSPSPSTHRDSQDLQSRAEADVCVEQQIPETGMRVRRERACLARLRQNSPVSAQQQKRAQHAAQVEPAGGAELQTQNAAVPRRKPPKILVRSETPPPPNNNSPLSPPHLKGKNTDAHQSADADLSELSSFRAASPPPSSSSQDAIQRSESMEGRQPANKNTLTELLDTLKLLEGEEPQQPPQPKIYQRDKYAWIDEDEDANSLTADNLERHGELSLHPALPDGGALLSEAKLHSIMSFLDEMEKSEQERPRSVTSGSHREGLLSEEELLGVEQASATAAEISGSMARVKMELEEKNRTVSTLQVALAQQRELTVRHLKDTEKELTRNFELQKEQYEGTIRRHLTFIDQLISDKKALSERCEGVLAELKQVDQKYMQKIAQMQQQHEMEIKKLKELMNTTEKIRREKWIDEKTKKIKEITVKGLEPEIQRLVSRHKQELKKLRTLHEAELLNADERAAQRYIRQSEELRQQLERERDEQCQRERELAKQRYERQLQEEEQSLQQQRRRLYKEVSEEKERVAQLCARQREELEELRQQLEENSSVAGRVLREELERSREEQERRHQVELKALQERLEVEKLSWEEKYKKKEEVWLLSRERELREELRRERDKEIELAIWTLEEETSKDKEECERTADNRVKRMREKYEVELRELECSERTAVEKQQDFRRQLMETETELIRLQGGLRQKEQEAEDITQIRDKLMEERRSLAEVIRQEFGDRLVLTDEENRRMKVELSELRARLQLEVERVSREKEAELAEVHKRVKSAISKKDETVSQLRKQHEAALKRADHLEALWEQQRKQLLDK